MILEGEAQDYVGKGMHGGVIVIRPKWNTPIARRDDKVIMGNTVMYGATGGSLFAAGMAGERLGVRNSGGLIVVEGCGDHGCEYMTGGVALILGETGRNFGAGMTGGFAYVFDEHDRISLRVNETSVRFDPVTADLDEQLIHALIERHFDLTGSTRAAWMKEHWPVARSRWRRVTPLIVDPQTLADSVEANGNEADERIALLERLRQVAAAGQAC